MKRTTTYTAWDIRTGDEPPGFELVPASDYDALKEYTDQIESAESLCTEVYESLKAERDALAKRINHDGTPVDIAALCVEIDEVTDELARVKAESLRVVPNGEPCSLFELESSGCHLFRHVTGGPVYIMDTVIKGRSNTDSGRAHWCAKLNGVTKEWAQYDDYAPIQPVRLERWEAEG